MRSGKGCKMKTVYIFGDSLLRGVMPDEQGLYHSTNSIGYDELEDRYQLCIKNYAMPTFTVKQGWAWMQKHMEASETYPDLAILEFGGNDCDYRWSEMRDSCRRLTEIHRTPIDEFVRVYTDMTEYLADRGIETAVTLCPQFPVEVYLQHLIESGIPEQLVKAYVETPDMLIRDYKAYKREIVKLAEEKQLSVIDIEKTFAFLPDLEDYYSADGLHPNVKGYRLIHDVFARFFDAL